MAEQIKSRTYTAIIVRYDNKRGLNGKLLGLVTFTDGKSLKVWDGELHRQLQHLEQFRPCEVSYTFKHSDKWGDSLDTLTPTKAEHELYDQARCADEALMTGRFRPGKFTHDMISKRVQSHLDAERKAGR
jgi:hypothetical protein